MGVRGFPAYGGKRAFSHASLRAFSTAGRRATSNVAGVTLEEAIAYAEKVIDKECADQGVPVAFTDPALRNKMVRILRAGRRRHNALRAEVTP